jgi:hypothetical protein
VKKYCQQHNLLKGATNQSNFHETLATRKKTKTLKSRKKRGKRKTFVLSKASFSSLKLSCHNEANNCL